jgi:predicted transglutaminase-like cysteine proteinase
MLVRIAACAAWLFAWSICPGVDRGMLRYPGITVAVAQVQKTAQHQASVGSNQNVDPQGRTEAAARPRGSSSRATNQPVSPEIAPGTAAEPFGLAAEQVSAGEILPKWARVQSEIRQNKEVLARCREGGACPEAARRFLAIIDEGRARSGRARIGVINREINLAIIPTGDLEQWGVVDRWSPPLETFTTGRGDCEDYAIAKYVALTAAGVPPEDIKLVVIGSKTSSENHAVVAVLVDGAWVILDNRWLALVPDHDLWRATPLFAINENGVRQFLAPTAGDTLPDGALASFGGRSHGQ